MKPDRDRKIERAGFVYIFEKLSQDADLDIHLPHNRMKLTSFTIDSLCLSPRELWDRMGSPETVSPADVLLMNRASGPCVSMDVVSGPRWQSSLVLQPYSIRLICIDPLQTDH